MADVTYLGFGQSRGFDNTSATVVIGQEVARSEAEVSRKGRVIFPPSSDTQSNLSNLRASSEVLRGGLGRSQSALNQESAPFVPALSHGQSVGIFRNYLDPPDVVLNPLNPLPNADTSIGFFGGGPLAPWSVAPESAGLDNLGNLRSVPIPYAPLNTSRDISSFTPPTTINLAATATGCAGLMLRFTDTCNTVALRGVRIRIASYNPVTPSLTLLSAPPAVPTTADTFVIEPIYTVMSISSPTHLVLSAGFATGYYQSSYNVQLPDLGIRFTSYTFTAGLRSFAIYPVLAFWGSGDLWLNPVNLPANIMVARDTIELVLPPVKRITPNIEVILG